MLIVMDKDATPEMIQEVVAKIEALGYAAQPIPGGERVATFHGDKPGRGDHSAVVAAELRRRKKNVGRRVHFGD